MADTPVRTWVSQLPPEMVEAVATELAVQFTGFYEFAGEDIREEWRQHAREVLTAALTVCEVQEVEGFRQVRTMDGRAGIPSIAWNEGADDGWPRRALEVWRAEGGSPVTEFSVVRRLVIRTPPETVAVLPVTGTP